MVLDVVTVSSLLVDPAFESAYGTCCLDAGLKYCDGVEFQQLGFVNSGAAMPLLWVC